MPPLEMIERSKNRDIYFRRLAAPSEEGGSLFAFKTREEFEAEQERKLPPLKTYHQISSLDNIADARKRRKHEPAGGPAEQQKLSCFIDFLKGLLRMDPETRWTPKQARRHPFITSEEYTGPFDPT